MNIFLTNEGRLRAIWRIVLVVSVILAANILAARLASYAADNKPLRFEAIYRPVLMLLLISGYVLLLITLDKVKRRYFAAIGLGRRRWLRDSALGAGVGAGMVTAAVGVIASLGSVRFHIKVDEGTLRVLLVETWVLLTAAMAEELMFRGYPFQRLVKAVGAWGAIAIFSGLFGAVHAGNPHASVWGFLNTIFIGILLSLAYLRTRALWLPWGIHFGWNAMLGVGFGLPVSGLTEFAVMVKGTARGPQWLTGGSYGIEASATGALVILLGFIPVLALRARAEEQAQQPFQAASNSGEQQIN